MKKQKKISDINYLKDIMVGKGLEKNIKLKKQMNMTLIQDYFLKNIHIGKLL